MKFKLKFVYSAKIPNKDIVLYVAAILVEGYVDLTSTYLVRYPINLLHLNDFRSPICLYDLTDIRAGISHHTNGFMGM